MRGYHDIGGLQGEKLDLTERVYEPWEKRVDALLVILVERGLITLDEHRRVHESLGDRAYNELKYYERWIAATANLLIMKGVLTLAEISNKMIEVQARAEQGDDSAL
jgi:hypothetical protein